MQFKRPNLASLECGGEEDAGTTAFALPSHVLAALLFTFGNKGRRRSGEEEAGGGRE